MASEIKFIFKKLDKKDLYSKNIIDGYKSWKVVHTDDGGYTENEIEFYLYDDGMIGMSNHDSESGFISLYPEQIDHLKRVLSTLDK